MVFEKIQKLITELLGIDASKVTMSTNIIDDLGADSLDITQMLITLENEFNLEFDESQSESLKTVGNIVKFIEESSK